MRRIAILLSVGIWSSSITSNSLAWTQFPLSGLSGGFEPNVPIAGGMQPHAMVIGLDGNLWRWNGSSWNQYTTSGDIWYVSQNGGSGPANLGFLQGNTIWVEEPVGGPFTALPPPSPDQNPVIESIAMGDGNQVFVTALESDGVFHIYASTSGGSGPGWCQMGGAATRVAVGSNGIPWVVAPDETIWRFRGGSFCGGSWDKMQGLAVSISGGWGGWDVWVLGTDLNPYFWNGFEFAPGPPTGSIFGGISTDSLGNVWIVGTGPSEDAISVWTNP